MQNGAIIIIFLILLYNTTMFLIYICCIDCGGFMSDPHIIQSNILIFPHMINNHKLPLKLHLLGEHASGSHLQILFSFELYGIII